jgi:hypothetical protein
MSDELDPQRAALDRTRFFDRYNLRWIELRQDPRAWREIREERAVENGTVIDESR